MAHVFISYAHVDEEYVGSLKDELQNVGFSVWTDDDISPGDKWSKAIDDAINDSFALVVVMSVAARASEYVTYEWSFALGRNIPVIPLLLEKIDYHPRLQEIQRIDYSKKGFKTQDEALKKLTKRLKELGEISKAKVVVSENISSFESTGFYRDLISDNVEKRKNAATTLGEIKDERAVSYLINALDDEKPSVKAAVALALGRIADKVALPDILRVLRNNKGQEIRLNLIWALGEIADERAIEYLYSLFEFGSIGKDSREQEFAIRAIAKIGTEKGYAALSEIAHNKYCVIAIRLFAIDTLTLSDNNSVVASLYTLLVDQNDEIQRAAISALEKLGTQDALDHVAVWYAKKDSNNA